MTDKKNLDPFENEKARFSLTWIQEELKLKLQAPWKCTNERVSRSVGTAKVLQMERFTTLSACEKQKL